jgi:hypothetical protein
MKPIIQGPLSPHQRTQVKAVGVRLASLGPAAELTDQHFRDACNLAEIDTQRQAEMDPRIAVRLRLEAARLGHKLTPAAKSAAIEVHRAIIRAALAEIRAQGRIKNIVQFTKSLSDKNMLTRAHGSSHVRARNISHKAVRAVLKRYLGITEKPGRRSP